MPSRNTAAIVALVAGVLAILVNWAGLGLLAAVFGPTAIVAGVLGNRAATRTGRGAKMAVGGLLLGLLGLVAAFAR